MEFAALYYFGLVANLAEIGGLVLVLITIHLVSKEINET
jgi:hypothetical protein